MPHKTKYKVIPSLDLFVENYVSAQDAKRQQTTAEEILARIQSQPGVILADEVGMGKTFVALAVAVSSFMSDEDRRPVVVMVPPSVKEKWVRDFTLFRDNCIKDSKIGAQLKCKVAERTEDFLKLLDDEVTERAAVVILTHGAMSRGLTDKWVKLALIQRALKGRHNTESLQNALSKYLPRILQLESQSRALGEKEAKDFWAKLLDRPVSDWKSIINRSGLLSEPLLHDPVSSHLVAVMKSMSTTELDRLYWGLQKVMIHKTTSNERLNERTKEVRAFLKAELSLIWKAATSRLNISSSLLIMDEAHHLKNAKTQIAQLFQTSESQSDMVEISKGNLAGVFDRMLFLTATPFQLGHHELINVLNRFEGINWHSLSAEAQLNYKTDIRALLQKLDSSQLKSLVLDKRWGQLTAEDVKSLNPNWWKSSGDTISNVRVEAVQIAFKECKAAMRDSEGVLKTWVIRHLRARKFQFAGREVARRSSIEGAGIVNESLASCGLEIPSQSLFPFLMAARAVAGSPNTRPVFAEGLASSYEAFLDTRKGRLESSSAALDEEAEEMPAIISDPRMDFYLNQIEKAVGRADGFVHAAHPKVTATAEKAVQLWKSGEKVLIFCHYFQTGRALRHSIAEKVNQLIISEAAVKFGKSEDESKMLLQKLQRSLDKQTDIFEDLIDELLEDSALKQLRDYRDDLISVVKKMARTPSFLVRYFPLSKYVEDAQASKKLVRESFDCHDGSGLTFRASIERFLKFLASRRNATDYLSAVRKIKTGWSSSIEGDVEESFDDAEGVSSEQNESNAVVRLANGSVTPATRAQLTLAFNTPFFPEILIASSVMAEGVDLHLNCRHIIHHDLSWNPSILEQRSGRVDRIGAKVEQCGQPIQIYLPYVAATQDEKMFKVVMDRERWFKVVMGDKVKIDSAIETEKQAARVPFPEDAANELAFKLNVA